MLQKIFLIQSIEIVIPFEPPKFHIDTRKDKKVANLNRLTPGIDITKSIVINITLLFLTNSKVQRYLLCVVNFCYI